MKSREESVQEVIRGLEGLEMLSQWELSLARDLRGKAEAVLRNVRGEDRPADAAPKGD